MIEEEKPISVTSQRVHLCLSKEGEKMAVLNIPSEKASHDFGRVKVKVEIDPGEVQSELRKKEAVKKEFPSMKGKVRSSKNPKKLYNFTLPMNRNNRRYGDSRVHFLFELNHEESVLTVVEDYCDVSMTVSDPRQKKQDALHEVMRQKKLLDRRRKSPDRNDYYNDPDFNDHGEESDRDSVN